MGFETMPTTGTKSSAENNSERPRELIEADKIQKKISKQIFNKMGVRGFLTQEHWGPDSHVVLRGNLNGHNIFLEREYDGPMAVNDKGRVNIVCEIDGISLTPEDEEKIYKIYYLGGMCANEREYDELLKAGREKMPYEETSKIVEELTTEK